MGMAMPSKAELDRHQKQREAMALRGCLRELEMIARTYDLEAVESIETMTAKIHIVSAISLIDRYIRDNE